MLNLVLKKLTSARQVRPSSAEGKTSNTRHYVIKIESVKNIKLFGFKYTQDIIVTKEMFVFNLLKQQHENILSNICLLLISNLPFF